jgi:hypothetical protein
MKALSLNPRVALRKRINSLRETIFSRTCGLTPQATYYYWVTSMGADGKSDGVQSLLSQFTTPAPGEQIVAKRALICSRFIFGGHFPFHVAQIRDARALYGKLPCNAERVIAS